MRVLKRLATAVVAAATLAAPTVGGAAVMVATYTGVVSVGYDTTGEFGVKGRYLNGLPFVGVFTYDPAVGQRITFPGIFDDNHSLRPYPLGRPEISTTLTIGGVTQNISADTATLILFQTINFYHNVYYAEDNGADYSNIRLYALRDTTNPSLDESFTIPDAVGFGEFSIHDYDPANGVFTRYVDGQFDVDTVTISAAPEPSAWGLMILGLGLSGGALRSRRRARPA